MLKADVLNWDGRTDSRVELNEKVFALETDKALLHSVVVWRMAEKRRGTHSTKTRSEVRGGGKKPFRQKGTGNARQGSIRSPLQEGGAVVHGPRPRSYGFSLPKKIRKKALGSALSFLNRENRLFIVKDMVSSDGKTKPLFNLLQKRGWEKALFVDEKKDAFFQRACGNLPGVKFISAEGLNVYDLLKFNRVVLTPESLKIVYRKCGCVSDN